MKTYIVTAKAPDEIYDLRVSVGDEIDLTSERAETPVRRGHLVLKPAEIHPAEDAPDAHTKDIEPDGAEQTAADASNGRRPKGRKR